MGPNGKEFLAVAGQQHGFLADVSRQHLTIGKVIDRDAARKIRTARIGVRCAHLGSPIGWFPAPPTLGWTYPYQ
jgi:hypothetical protein